MDGILRPAANGDGHAFAEQPFCDGATDPARTTRNDGELAGERFHKGIVAVWKMAGHVRIATGMAGAPTTPVQRLLQDRVAQLSAEVETLFQQTRERSRREFADQLNLAVRRMRVASDPGELLATLTDSAAAFADGAAVFRIAEEAARGEQIRGVPEESAERFRTLAIPLTSAAALLGAVESRDPVTTITSVPEVSAELIAIAGHTANGRASVFPLLVRDKVWALLYVWGETLGSSVELLSQVAAAVWNGLEPAAPPVPPQPELVQIAAPALTPAAKPGPTWESLPGDQQQVHLKAQRFARVHVAEMRLFEADAVQAGRAQRSLYEALRKPIDAARETFHRLFFASCPTMVDYLHLEMVRTLANDDPEVLGKDYPGPLV
jgi:hypothetical protein